MDRKGIIVLLISFVLLMLWFPLVNKLWPPKPRSTTTQTNLLPTITTQQVVTTTNLVVPPPPPPTEIVEPPQPEQLLALETSQARYTFTSYGGGMKKEREVLCKRGCLLLQTI